MGLTANMQRVSSEKKYHSIILAAFLLPLIIVTFSTFIVLAILPGQLDEFLLTNDEYCYPSPVVQNIGNADGIRQPSLPVHVDYGEYNSNMVGDGGGDGADCDGRTVLSPQMQSLKLQHRLLRKISLHLWEKKANGEEEDPTDTTTCPIPDTNNHQDKQNNGQIYELHLENSNRDTRRKKNNHLHPMCQEYRKIRSQLRFEQILLPWNWYYRTHIHVKGLSLHSMLDNAAFSHLKNSKRRHLPSWWNVGWSIITGKNVVSRNINPIDEHQQPKAQATLKSLSNLPPTMQIETVDISLQSWARPVISTHLNGIVINVVLQKGEGFSLPQLQKKNNQRIGPNKASNNSTALFIGDMTIPEVLEILPKPPDLEGTYPRIGVVNITNVTLCLYEMNNKRENKNDGALPSSLKLLLKLKVPDKFFLPVTKLTHAHQKAGIDRKHFQFMMESSLSIALRKHLLHEATTAFHKSWTSAHKAQAQLNNFIQELHLDKYLDKWIGTSVKAWHQTQVNIWRGVLNGTAPLVRAVDEWMLDIREIVSEPIPPLALVLSHYWNRTLDGINKHGKFIDNKVLGHFNELVALKVNHFKHEKRVSKHLGELKMAVDVFISKSSEEVQLLMQDIELEAKAIWLAWHRQLWL